MFKIQKLLKGHYYQVKTGAIFYIMDITKNTIGIEVVLVQFPNLKVDTTEEKEILCQEVKREIYLEKVKQFHDFSVTDLKDIAKRAGICRILEQNAKAEEIYDKLENYAFSLLEIKENESKVKGIEKQSLSVKENVILKLLPKKENGEK